MRRDKLTAQHTRAEIDDLHEEIRGAARERERHILEWLNAKATAIEQGASLHYPEADRRYIRQPAEQIRGLIAEIQNGDHLKGTQ